MPIIRQTPDISKFNPDIESPYQLRREDFALVMQDVYDFFFDVNTHSMFNKGIKRLDEMLRPAAMSGLISDMITASMAQHSRTLVENRYHNGHPDLIVNGVYPNDSVKAGEFLKASRLKVRVNQEEPSIRTAQGSNGCASLFT